MTVDRDQHTICAVSTPPGFGGISVIRVSGSGTHSLLAPMAPFLPAAPESHRLYYGHLINPKTKQHLDEVVIGWFAKGRSFTGELVAEISCHGNPLICAEIIEALVASGARPADRGEFTYRAFMNGRLDLVQAESVLGLIESRSHSAKRISLKQLEGQLSEKLAQLEDRLTWSLAHIEAGIDFSTEGLDVVDPSILISKVKENLSEVNRLLATFQSGRLLKEGLRLTLVGRPNVGKSSLMNNLVQNDRSIVTNIEGTTRDVVDAETVFEDLRFILSDTAGLRESSDVVEKIGIERSQAAMKRADAILFVVDAVDLNHPEDRRILEEIDLERTFLVINKMDLTEGERPSLPFEGKIPADRVIWVSSLDSDARNLILNGVKTPLLGRPSEADEVLVSTRHFELLLRAQKGLEKTLEGLSLEAGAEFIASDLREALLAVQEILGKYFDDQIMDRVFKEFCIGK